MKVKAKRLKSLLQQVDDFDNPRIELEQYITPLDISVDLLQHVNDLVGLDECAVADLGCGTGMLLIGCTLLGAQYDYCTGSQKFPCDKFAVGVDCCQSAISMAQNNIKKFEFDGPTTSQLVLADVKGCLPMGDKFDVVLTNPPFGTKNNQGTDIAFVMAGLNMLRPGGRLFSLHKSSTRNFLTKTAKRWDAVKEMKCIAELKWNLEPTFKFHKKNSVDINVILCSFEKA